MPRQSLAAAEKALLWQEYATPFIDRGLTAFTDSNIFLSVDHPVVPGQPIDFTVTFYSLTRKSQLGSGYYMEIFLEDSNSGLGDQKIFQKPSNGKALKFESGAPDLFNPLVVHDTILPPAPESSVGEMLYKIGQHSLRVELTTDGTDGGPFKNSDILVVMPLQAAQDMWTWQGDTLRSGAWKEEYIISGWCENTTQYSDLTFVLQLQETDESGSERVYNYPNVDLPRVKLGDSGGSQKSDLLEFKITQDWSWLVAGVWVPKGPLGNEFSYQVKMELHDRWGNVYPPFLSSAVSVVVNVSNTKVGLAQLAFSSTASAIALAIASGIVSVIVPLSVALALASAVAAAIGAGAGDKALDPPAPSLRFLENVEPIKFDLASKGMPKATEVGLQDVFRFFDRVGQILNHMTALGEVHSRLLGAQIQASYRGNTLQTANYNRIVSSMMESCRDLQDLARKAALSLNRADVYRTDLWKVLEGDEGSIVQKIVEALRKGRLSKSLTEVAVDVIQQTTARKSLISETALQTFFLSMSSSVTDVVMRIKRNSGAFLKELEVS